ncbi:hypothetical protein H4R18_003275 [Coemansia javaensis]|uniref:ribonuclease H n=1 Tax=Coemansia javaensis TaxID=2761396 RepID=A0A9W8HFY0_9FUNG|nr:hypothetical protein H4R18_003275 [Coemansia javaensis]
MRGAPRTDAAAAAAAGGDDDGGAWTFVYVRNIDIARVPAPALDRAWRGMGVDPEQVAGAGVAGAWVAEFVVRAGYRARFVELLASIGAGGDRVAAAVAVDAGYSPAAPHRRAIPDGCAVPQRALAALDEYARGSLARRWSAIYHGAERPGVRRLVRASLAEHGLALLPPDPPGCGTRSPERRSAQGAAQQASDLVRQWAPNHAVLSRQHLAELVPEASAARLVVYADGAFLPERGAAGIGVYFENAGIPPMAERLRGHQSAARAEICAVHMALDRLAAALPAGGGPGAPAREVWVCTDSQYVVDGANIYKETWQLANWLNSKGRHVANRTAFQGLFSAIQRLSARGYNVFIHHLPAHAEIPGNEFADVLAKAGALL